MNILVGTWSVDRQIYKRLLLTTNAELTGVPNTIDSEKGVVVGGSHWFEYYKLNGDFTYENVLEVSGGDDFTMPNGRTTTKGHYAISGNTVTLTEIEQRFVSSTNSQKNKVYDRTKEPSQSVNFQILDNGQTLQFENFYPISTFYRS